MNMASLADLDLKNVKENDFEVIPPGEYPAILIESEQKPTKDRKGQGLNLKFQILSGQYMNRTVKAWLNTHNNSETAQKIGRSELKSLCIAVNVPDPKLSEELHNKPLMIKVAVGKDQNNNPRNEIKGYKARVVPTAALAAPAAKEPNMIEQVFAGSDPAPKRNPFV
jgi:hypothetical protein